MIDFVQAIRHERVAVEHLKESSCGIRRNRRFR
jgi:hypothetical protein